MAIQKKEILLSQMAVFTSSGYGKNAVRVGERTKNNKAEKKRYERRFLNNFVFS